MNWWAGIKSDCKTQYNKSMKFYFFLAVAIPLLTGKCAQESEENQFYKQEQRDEYRYDENPVTKETAIEKWETFLAQSQDLIFYSRNNLESLEYQIEGLDGAEKFELVKDYRRFEKAIDALELKTQQRNDAFNAELSHYDQESDSRNKEFEKQFKREIIRINVGLGCRKEDWPDALTK